MNIKLKQKFVACSKAEINCRMKCFVIVATCVLMCARLSSPQAVILELLLLYHFAYHSQLLNYFTKLGELCQQKDRGRENEMSK